ncbi:MAG: accessory factor UbiK family protein [Pseudomonadota bacterium]
MRESNPLFDDLARVAASAADALGGVREEVESRVRDRIEVFARDMDLVTREEFDVVRVMAEEARAENERLRERIAALEAKASG